MGGFMELELLLKNESIGETSGGEASSSDEDESLVQCPICDEGCWGRSGVMKHLCLKHFLQDLSSEFKLPFQELGGECFECEFKAEDFNSYACHLGVSHEKVNPYINHRIQMEKVKIEKASNSKDSFGKVENEKTLNSGDVKKAVNLKAAVKKEITSTVSKKLRSEETLNTRKVKRIAKSDIINAERNKEIIDLNSNDNQKEEKNANLDQKLMPLQIETELPGLSKHSNKKKRLTKNTPEITTSIKSGRRNPKDSPKVEKLRIKIDSDLNGKVVQVSNQGKKVKQEKSMKVLKVILNRLDIRNLDKFILKDVLKQEVIPAQRKSKRLSQSKLNYSALAGEEENPHLEEDSLIVPKVSGLKRVKNNSEMDSVDIEAIVTRRNSVRKSLPQNNSKLLDNINVQAKKGKEKVVTASFLGLSGNDQIDKNVEQQAKSGRKSLPQINSKLLDNINVKAKKDKEKVVTESVLELSGNDQTDENVEQQEKSNSNIDNNKENSTEIETITINDEDSDTSEKDIQMLFEKIQSPNGNPRRMSISGPIQEIFKSSKLAFENAMVSGKSSNDTEQDVVEVTLDDSDENCSAKQSIEDKSPLPDELKGTLDEDTSVKKPEKSNSNDNKCDQSVIHDKKHEKQSNKSVTKTENNLKRSRSVVESGEKDSKNDKKHEKQSNKSITKTENNLKRSRSLVESGDKDSKNDKKHEKQSNKSVTKTENNLKRSRSMVESGDKDSKNDKHEKQSNKGVTKTENNSKRSRSVVESGDKDSRNNSKRSRIKRKGIDARHLQESVIEHYNTRNRPKRRRSLVDTGVKDAKNNIDVSNISLKGTMLTLEENNRVKSNPKKSNANDECEVSVVNTKKHEKPSKEIITKTDQCNIKNKPRITKSLTGDGMKNVKNNSKRSKETRQSIDASILQQKNESFTDQNSLKQNCMIDSVKKHEKLQSLLSNQSITIKKVNMPENISDQNSEKQKLMLPNPALTIKKINSTKNKPIESSERSNVLNIKKEEIEHNLSNDVMQCEYCLKKFSVKLKFGEHLMIHFKKQLKEKYGKSTECQLCIFKSPQNDLLLKHMVLVHNGLHEFVSETTKAHLGYNWMQCEYCEMKFLDNRGLKKHLVSSHFYKEFKVKYGTGKECPNCKKRYSRDAGLFEHIGLNHGGLLDFVSDKTKNQLRCHFSKESKEEAKATNQNITKNKINSLEKESVEHIGNENKVDLKREEAEKKSCNQVIQCGYCTKSYSFSSKWRFEEHLMTHFNKQLKTKYGKETMCQLCKFKFPQEEGLLRHMVWIHNALYEFIPEYMKSVLQHFFPKKGVMEPIIQKKNVPQNVKGSSTENCPSSNNIAQKNKEQANAKGNEINNDFQCEYCEKKQISKSRLREHLVTHVFDKIKSKFGHHTFCPFCKKSFPVKKGLLRHIGLSHDVIEEFISDTTKVQLGFNLPGPLVTAENTVKKPLIPNIMKTAMRNSFPHASNVTHDSTYVRKLSEMKMRGKPTSKSNGPIVVPSSITITPLSQKIKTQNMKDENTLNSTKDVDIKSVAKVSSDIKNVAHVSLNAKNDANSTLNVEPVNSSPLVEKSPKLLQNNKCHCSKCNSWINGIYPFKKHLLSHYNDQLRKLYDVPGKCPGCDKVYKKVVEMNRHIGLEHRLLYSFVFDDALIQLGLKRDIANSKVPHFVCPICDKDYAVGRFRNHILRAHWEDKNKCKICGQIFLSNVALQNHVKLRHKKEEKLIVKKSKSQRISERISA